MNGSWSAVILAGGSGRRLGGVDKPALVVRGRTLLDRAVEACAGADEIVVVGPRRPGPVSPDSSTRPVRRDRVRWTREDPPGGGPLAALAAALPVLAAGSAVVVVLAADLPLIDAALVRRLRDALDPEVDAVAAADSSGRPQLLVAAYRRQRLAEAVVAAGDPRDRPFRSVAAALRLTTIAADGGAEDIDTPNDLARWTGLAGETDPQDRLRAQRKVSGRWKSG